MRTTLTIENDVAKEIERIRRKRGGGWKETIHTVRRAGIVTLSKAEKPAARPPLAAPTWELPEQAPPFTRH